MERRLYQRVFTKARSNFIVIDNPPGLREFGGVIDDVSENGIKISVSDPGCAHIISNINVESKIAFQAIDEYEVNGEVHAEVFSGEAKVIRIDKDKENVIIGCKVVEATKEFDEYVKNRKMALFIKRGYFL